MKKLFSLVLLSLISFTACNEDDNENIDPGVAPEIPPVTTFLMDFSITVGNEEGRLDSKENWIFSAINVGVWNTVIVVTFAVPVASFVESFNHEPTFDPGLPGWIWEYDYTVLNSTYHAKLQGEITLSSIEWDMFISLEGVYEDFNWYSGSSKLDGLSGSWQLNDNPNDPKDFLAIDWNRTAAGEISDIKYTNIVDGTDDNGSFIFFEIDEAGGFDRQYDIFNNPENNSTEIEWSSTTSEGRVKDQNHFGDDEYHCWDEILDDVDCPS